MTVAIKPERLEARIDPDVKALLSCAAQMCGRTLTDFVIDSARQAAEKTIRDHAVISLTMRDTVVLNEALSNPPAPNERLREAFKLHDALIGG